MYFYRYHILILAVVTISRILDCGVLLGIEIEESDELFKPIGGAEEGDGKTPGLTNEKGQELAYHYKPSMWNAARYGLKRGLKRILK